MSARTTEFIAKVTGDVDKAIASLERVKQTVNQTGEASRVASNKMASASETANKRIAASNDQLIKSTEKVGRGVAAVTQAIYGMEAQGSARVLALGSSVGNFADLFGPAGKLVSGVAIASTAIIALFMQAKEKSEEATKKIQADIAQLVNAGDFAALKKKLEEIDRGTAGADFKDGRTAIRERIAALESEAQAVGKTNRYYQERFTKITAEKAALAELDDQFRRYSRALTDPNNGGRSARGLEGAVISSSADSVEAQKRKAKEIADAAKKQAEEFRKLVASINLDIGRIVAKAEDEQRELAEKTRKQLADESTAREKANADLKDQVATIQQGAGAYEALLLKQTQQIAVEKALADAKAAKIVLSDTDLDKIRDQIAETSRLTKLLDALKSLDGKNPFDITDSVGPAGEFAEHLSMAASAAQGIASAFGESGQQLANIIGQSSQLLTNISRAQKAGIFRPLGADKDKNVGFLGALQGKAGAAGTFSAVSASLGIVGAVSSILDAGDLFGKGAKQLAREIRERAIAFNDGLEQFVIAQRTDLDEKLRQNIDQANALAKTAGAGDTAFGSVDDIKQFADGLRAMADSIRDKRNRDNVLGIADALDRLGVEAEANEAKLRAANESAIARLREDLNVRKVALALGSDAAEQERSRLDIARQEAELRDKYGIQAEDFIADLIAVARAEAAVAAETKRRAAIMQQLADDNSLLGGTGADRLQRSITAFNASFGQFSGIFDGLDLATRDGLSKAKDLIKSIYQNLVDTNSEAVRPLIDFLKSLFGDVDSILSSLPETLDPIASALEAFGERVSLFKLTIPEQMAELARIFTGSFGDWFDSVLAGVDLTNAAGRSSFKDILEAQINAILADGVISEGERTLYNALKQMLGLVNQSIEDAANEASAAAAEQLAGRDRNRSFFGNVDSIFDLEGAEAFRTKLLGFGTAFSDLFAQFDLASVEGIDQAKTSLRSVFETLQSMTDEEILARFGITRDELVSALLDTNAGLNSLKDGLNSVEDATRTAAQATKDFVESVSQDFLRSQGQGQVADANDAKKRRDERLAQAAQMGLGADILAQIEAIYQADLADIAAKYAVAPTPVSAADSPNVSSAARASSSARRGNSTLVQDFGGLSEVTAQSLAGVLRQIAINTSDAGAIVAALTGRTTLRPLSSLSFPAFPTSTVGNGGVMIGTINVSIGSLNPMGMSHVEAASAVAREISRELGAMVSQRAKYLGSNRA